MSKKALSFGVILTAVFLLISGCTFPWQKPAANTDQPAPAISSPSDQAPTVVSSTNAVKKFTDYTALKQFLADNYNPESYSAGPLLFRGSAGMMGGAEVMTSGVAGNSSALAVPATAGLATDQSASTPSSASGAGVNLDYSSTNNQVAGVDEADIIKTNGNYIYALVRNDLYIIKAVPATAAQTISKITFASRPDDIFIDGNYLAVFGSDQQIYAQPLYATFKRQNPYTFFKVFDLSDAANPKLVRDLDLEGSYTDARLIGDYAYLITNTFNQYIASEPPLPRVLDKGAVLSTDCSVSSHCFAPDVYYFDMPYDAFNYTNLTAINLANADEAPSGESYLTNNTQTIYVSAHNVYLTYTQYLNEYDIEQDVKKAVVSPNLSADDQNKIKQIEAAHSYILNQNEKRLKVGAIIDHYLNSLEATARDSLQATIDQNLKDRLAAEYKDMEKTIVHKIAIDNNKITYQGMGSVSGTLLNQFSLDENNNYLRLATTRNQTWSRLSATSTDSYSNVYVLDQDLKLAGALENLATSERIYAARFMGDRLYLVTYRQTDPLYVIGLSDPTKPAILGAVKISGYSTYLHPVDANGTKLLGFGRETTENMNGSVTTQGLKLTLFDLTDLAKPKEADSYIIGDASANSIALYDHKAFLYSAAKNLLSIPAVLYDSGKLSFAGALVFGLENDHFTLKGRVDHSAGGHFSTSDYWGGYGYYDNTVKRSLYIGDNLYTFSNKFLKINNLADLNELKSLELTPGGDDYIITPGATSGGGPGGSGVPNMPSLPGGSAPFAPGAEPGAGGGGYNITATGTGGAATGTRP